MEAADRKSLSDPIGRIIEPGGQILMVRYRGNTVGTRALIRMDDTTFELAKMAVDGTARGPGIAWRA